jgi:AraC-like DNA-binding protein
MTNGAGIDTDHGILAPSAVNRRFTLTRHAPSADLAAIVDRFWLVRWDRRGEPPFAQETLPFPCVNLVIGTHRPGIHGPLTTRFVALLEGEGWVVGTKFRPAGFRALCAIPPAQLVDRVYSLGEVFGAEGSTLDRAVLELGDDRGRIDLVQRFVRAHAKELDADGHEVNRIVDRVRIDPTIVRVADLAAGAGRPVRALERLFRAHVGMSPKSVIQRFRVQEAAVRLANGSTVDCASLAQELGFFDQAHFIRAFKTQVGQTPAQYARSCR